MRRFPATRSPSTACLMLSTCCVFMLAGSIGHGQVTLKIASQAPEQGVWGKSLQVIATDVAAATENRVLMKPFFSGVQGDERTVLRKIRVGQLQGATFIGPALTDVCPDSLAFHLPGLFETAEEFDDVLSALREPLEAQIASAQMQAVGWPQLGFSRMFSTEAVDSMDKLRAGKPWLIKDDPMSEYLFKELGVAPVPANSTDVLAALQSGLVQTVFSPPFGLISFQWHTRIAYSLDMNLNFSIGVIVVSQSAWQMISPADQKLVRSIVDREVAALNTVVRQQNKDSMKVLKERGIVFLSPTPGSREEFLQAGERVAARMRGKEFSVEIHEQILGQLARLRKTREAQ